MALFLTHSLRLWCVSAGVTTRNGAAEPHAALCEWWGKFRTFDRGASRDAPKFAKRLRLKARIVLTIASMKIWHSSCKGEDSRSVTPRGLNRPTGRGEK